MKQKEQCPRYGMRKLSVGFVSCLLGFTLIAGFFPGSSYAASSSGANNPSAANRNGTVVEYRLTSHHGKHDKVDAKLLATSNKDERRGSVTYDGKKRKIEWKSLKNEIRDIDGLWIDGREYRRGRKKDKLGRQQYYYKKGEIYIEPGLKTDYVVNLKIKGRHYGFKYDGRNLNAIKDKDLFPLKKPNKIKVGDPNALTEAEKQEIIRQVKQLNPHAVEFVYDNNEYLLLYYPDGSRWGIPLDRILVKDESKANEEKLVKAKEKAKATVDKLNFLDDAAKEEINKKIDDAKDTAIVDKIVEDAKTANAEAKAAKEKRILDAKKNAAKDYIAGLKELTEEERAVANNAIEAAKSAEAVNGITQKYKKINDEHVQAKIVLDAEKNVSKDAIDKLGNLSEKEKTDAKTAIDQAKDTDAVKAIVDKAKATNETREKDKIALDAAKKAGKEEVDKLPNLSEDTKNGIKDQIDKATNEEEIATLVEDATKKNNAEAEKALADKKDEAKKEVDKLPNLSEDTKNGIKEDIDKAGDVGAVNKIVEEAKEEDTNAEFAERVRRAKKEAQDFMASMDKTVLESQSIHYLADDGKGKIYAAIDHSNELLALADEAIDEAKLKEIENIPSKKDNGKKTGIFRGLTKQALVDYEVLGTRDQLNPQNKKSYVALKDNKIKIRSNLVGAGKIGENKKAFFKLNYVTEADYAVYDTPAKPMAASFRSAQVEMVSTATPKYKKQEVSREDYTVKAVDGGYEITITKLPENAKYIKPIVYVKFANETFFENGDMVAVTATENPSSGTETPGTPGGKTPGTETPGTEKPNPVTPGTGTETPGAGTETPGGKTPGTPSTPVVPNNNRGGGRGSSSHSIWYTTGQSSQEKKPEPVLQAEAPKLKHQAFIFGYGDNSFRPEGKISRAEAASMIAALAGLDTSNKAKPGFKDTDSSWYNEVINAMVKNDLMLADKNGNFRPNEPITRAEFARALAGIDKKTDRIAPFADVKGHPFEAAINQAFGNGRIIGYPDGTFKPDGAITRAEAVTILNRYDGRTMSKQDLMKIRGKFNSFKDVSENHWAYVQILMAANNYQAMLDALAAHK